jgi:hypothetical protein
MAWLIRPCNLLSITKGGLGGNGAGTNALHAIPPAIAEMYSPVIPLSTVLYFYIHWFSFVFWLINLQ